MVGHSVYYPYWTTHVAELIGDKLIYKPFDFRLNQWLSIFRGPDGMNPYFIVGVRHVELDKSAHLASPKHY